MDHRTGARAGLATLRCWLQATALATLMLGGSPTGVSASPHARSFADFVAHLWPEARHRGVSRATFDAAFAGVTPDPDVIAKTHRQAEFTKTTGEYLASAVSDKRIATGSAVYKQWAPWLARAEQRYGVDRYVILGVWGLETNFGSYAGNDYVVRSLSTLAYAPLPRRLLPA